MGVSLSGTLALQSVVEGDFVMWIEPVSCCQIFRWASPFLGALALRLCDICMMLESVQVERLLVKSTKDNVNNHSEQK
jgi:hypothetical protein